jgi:hypothetical protein
MPDNHDDKLDRILTDTAQIKAALWPDPNQPGVLTKYDERLDELEDWRSTINGGVRILGFLWAGLAALFGFHVSGGK